MSEMTYEEAQDVVSHVVAERLKWGKMYKASDIGMFKILDALAAMAKGASDDFAEGDLRKSLATANRQLGAAKARAVQAKTTIADLRTQVAQLKHGGDETLDKDFERKIEAFPLQFPTEPHGDVGLVDILKDGLPTTEGDDSNGV